ncbi:MAG TPA: immunity protein [Ligilactobacillus acidipiscis]|uniref:Immunity protein n=1 Tax=Ligilactobacillus acidipiscis TaxID=89059 RepID=A0A921JZM4_9LACO|nr:immunity protein [Ligilactobacillus acidipiscis]
MKKLSGILFILIGIWEFYAVYQSFKNVQKKGNENTSGFMPLSLWSGGVFGLIMIGIGTTLLCNTL